MMKRTTWILIAVVGGILVLSGVFLVQSQTDQASREAMTTKEEIPDQMMPTEEASEDTRNDEDDSMMGDKIESGSYIPYSETVLANAKDTRRVLFFYANWCPTCQPADKAFEAQKEILPKDVTLIRVNYNDTDTDQAEKALAKQYGVTYQHTFVQIDADGTAVTRWNGGQIDELVTRLK